MSFPRLCGSEFTQPRKIILKDGSLHKACHTNLEQDAVVGDVPPEVGDGVPAVSSAHLDLQHAVAVQIRANLTWNMIKS